MTETKNQTGPKTPNAMKRFYKDVACELGEGGYGVALDGKSIKTPQRMRLAVPSKALGEDIAAEWQAQGEHILPDTMPLSRIANSAIDWVGAQREAVIGEICGYASSDLLFYRAEDPSQLAEHQGAAWDAMVKWAEGQAGCRLMLAAGIVHVEQPPQALTAFEKLIGAHNDFALAALSTATTLSGSALLSLGVSHCQIDADAAWAAAHVDEDWQIAQWGTDAEATARRANRTRDFMAAVRILDLCRT